MKALEIFFGVLLGQAC